MNFITYFFRETWKGRTIFRLLFQWELLKHRELFTNREVLHIASGGNPSYGPLIYPVARKVVKTDYVAKKGVDQVLDFNEPFPFTDASFDVVLLCNALYIADDPNFTLSEVRRVLRPDGVFVLISPFVANEMPEPHDYVRWTREGLRKMTVKLFTEVQMKSIGERGTSAMYALQPFLFCFPLRVLGYAKGLLLDKILPKRVKDNHPFPLGYCMVAIPKK